MILAFRYFNDELSVKIFKIKPGKGDSSLKIEYSQDLDAFRSQLKNIFKRRQKEMNERQKDGVKETQADLLIKLLDEYVYKNDIGGRFSNSLFIPAGRSFFANLQKKCICIFSKQYRN